ncbi:hypothetical protein LSAT2_003705 [Lamellibrachia satsuma]|nr:hypothetical protein LSAT2_003705 [Lamellibrachia satsuma]
MPERGTVERTATRPRRRPLTTTGGCRRENQVACLHQYHVTTLVLVQPLGPSEPPLTCYGRQRAGQTNAHRSATCWVQHLLNATGVKRQQSSHERAP